MSLFGFDPKGCRRLRVVSYTLEGGTRTDITSCVIEAEYADGTIAEVLLVHAESSEARHFYLHLVPEFEPSPTDDLHLVLLMKDIRRSLRR